MICARCDEGWYFQVYADGAERAGLSVVERAYWPSSAGQTGSGFRAHDCGAEPPTSIAIHPRFMFFARAWTLITPLGLFSRVSCARPLLAGLIGRRTRPPRKTTVRRTRYTRCAQAPPPPPPPLTRICVCCSPQHVMIRPTFALWKPWHRGLVCPWTR